MDFNKTHIENARFELHKNALSSFEKFLEVTLQEPRVVRTSISHIKKKTAKTSK